MDWLGLLLRLLTLGFYGSGDDDSRRKDFVAVSTQWELITSRQQREIEELRRQMVAERDEGRVGRDRLRAQIEELKERADQCEEDRADLRRIVEGLTDGPPH